MITDALNDIDGMISDKKARNIARAKEIDGFIAGFVRYLETRDKAEILKQNIHKVKKVLRSDKVDDIWT